MKLFEFIIPPQFTYLELLGQMAKWLMGSGFPAM